MICPLCCSSSLVLWNKDNFRSYFLCENCELISVPREEMLAFSKERERYEAHQNAEEDPGYQSYLGSIVSGIIPFIKVHHRGLDFGCGRTQLMGRLFDDHQIMMDSYDLHFLPKEKIWNQKYDFIVLSEVIEHLASPLETMKKLRGCLTEKGQFFIKTKYCPSKDKFGDWFYKRDLTHVQFFNMNSMGFLARQLGLKGPMEIGLDLVRLWN